ncbi:hypothetical protein RJ641_015383 [Dillenia turbinata]|uniref:plastoquinol--plastocyanin reductase n=1 Tax=Dillenia turbinata TaxID=194707 RepID=A0AAN8URX7_9MAGN
MNWLVLGTVSLPTAGMVVPYASFFVPPGSGSAGEGTVAKDALGNDIFAAQWLKTHGPGDRTLTQGLKGSNFYQFGIRMYSAHTLVVLCHGSQYNNQGRVVRGPAPLSLALAHCDVDEGKVVFVPWVETDFRTGEAPWWA